MVSRRCYTWGISLSLHSCAAVTIGLEATQYTVQEEGVGGATAEVCGVITSGTLMRDVSVTLQTADGSAMGTNARLSLLSCDCVSHSEHGTSKNLSPPNHHLAPSAKCWKITSI